MVMIGGWFMALFYPHYLGFRPPFLSLAKGSWDDPGSHKGLLETEVLG